MSLNEKIIGVAKPLVGVCVPGTYDGGSEEIYSTFNFTLSPDDFGDGTPGAAVGMVQLHLYLPKEYNGLQLRRDLRRAIAAEELFTAPTEVDAGDEDGQHYVYEFGALEEW